MLSNIIAIVTLISYLGSPHANEIPRQREILVMFQQGIVEMPKGKASASISRMNQALY